MTDPVELIVHKPTAAIQIGNQFSLVERKLLNTLIYHSQRDGDFSVAESEQQISLTHLYDSLAWTDSKNSIGLKNALKTLNGTIIEWNEFGTDRAESWTTCTFLAYGTIERGKLRFMLNPKIVQQMNRPTLFAKMRLLVQGRFAKRYSLILWEFLCDEISRSKKKRILVSKVELVFLVKLLGLEDTAYAAEGGYKSFNQKILKPCITELNKHSDLIVKAIPKRSGRRVTMFDFDVTHKDAVQLALHLDDNPEQLPSQHAAQVLIEQLVHHGVQRDKAEALAAEHSHERVVSNIDYTLQQITVGRINANRGGYLASAIKNNYANNVSAAEKADNEYRRELGKIEESRKHEADKGEALEEAFREHQRQRLREAFGTKSKTFQTRRKKLFAERFESGSLHLFKKQWEVSGLDSPMLAGIFFQEMIDDLLTEPQDRDLEGYRDWRQQQLS